MTSKCQLWLGEQAGSPSKPAGWPWVGTCVVLSTLTVFDAKMIVSVSNYGALTTKDLGDGNQEAEGEAWESEGHSLHQRSRSQRCPGSR